jgi:hypothetical protein
MQEANGWKKMAKTFSRAAAYPLGMMDAAAVRFYLPVSTFYH